ncbi:MAG: response regulator [Gammaproteobacteria bacterium]
MTEGTEEGELARLKALGRFESSGPELVDEARRQAASVLRARGGLLYRIRRSATLDTLLEWLAAYLASPGELAAQRLTRHIELLTRLAERPRPEPTAPGEATPVPERDTEILEMPDLRYGWPGADDTDDNVVDSQASDASTAPLAETGEDASGDDARIIDDVGPATSSEVSADAPQTADETPAERAELPTLMREAEGTHGRLAVAVELFADTSSESLAVLGATDTHEEDLLAALERYSEGVVGLWTVAESLELEGLQEVFNFMNTSASILSAETEDKRARGCDLLIQCFASVQHYLAYPAGQTCDELVALLCAPGWPSPLDERSAEAVRSKLGPEPVDDSGEALPTLTATDDGYHQNEPEGGTGDPVGVVTQLRRPETADDAAAVADADTAAQKGTPGDVTAIPEVTEFEQPEPPVEMLAALELFEEITQAPMATLTALEASEEDRLVALEQFSQAIVNLWNMAESLGMKGLLDVFDFMNNSVAILSSENEQGRQQGFRRLLQCPAKIRDYLHGLADVRTSQALVSHLQDTGWPASMSPEDAERVGEKLAAGRSEVLETSIRETPEPDAGLPAAHADAAQNPGITDRITSLLDDGEGWTLDQDEVDTWIKPAALDLSDGAGASTPTNGDAHYWQKGSSQTGLRIVHLPGTDVERSNEEAPTPQAEDDTKQAAEQYEDDGPPSEEVRTVVFEEDDEYDLQYGVGALASAEDDEPVAKDEELEFGLDHQASSGVTSEPPSATTEFEEPEELDEARARRDADAAEVSAAAEDEQVAESEKLEFELDREASNDIDGEHGADSERPSEAVELGGPAQLDDAGPGHEGDAEKVNAANVEEARSAYQESLEEDTVIMEGADLIEFNSGYVEPTDAAGEAPDDTGADAERGAEVYDTAAEPPTAETGMADGAAALDPDSDDLEQSADGQADLAPKDQADAELDQPVAISPAEVSIESSDDDPGVIPAFALAEDEEDDAPADEAIATDQPGAAAAVENEDEHALRIEGAARHQPDSNGGAAAAKDTPRADTADEEATFGAHARDPDTLIEDSATLDEPGQDEIDLSEADETSPGKAVADTHEPGAAEPEPDFPAPAAGLPSEETDAGEVERVAVDESTAEPELNADTDESAAAELAGIDTDSPEEQLPGSDSVVIENAATDELEVTDADPQAADHEYERGSDEAIEADEAGDVELAVDPDTEPPRPEQAIAAAVAEPTTDMAHESARLSNQAKEIVAVLASAVGDCQEPLGETLNMIDKGGEQDALFGAVAQYSEVIANLSAAAESVNLTGLQTIFDFMNNSAAILSSDTPKNRTRGCALLNECLIKLKAYLGNVLSEDLCRGLAMHLNDGDWPSPLSTDDAETLYDALLNEPRAISEEERPRPQRVEPEDVSLTLADDVDMQLREVFLNEAPGNVAELRDALERINGDGDVATQAHTAQRAAHTLKGSANLIGCPGVATLTHHMEDILEHLANKKIAPPPMLRTVMLDAADTLETMLDTLAGADEEMEDDDVMSVCQDVLDWANRIDAGLLETDDEIAANEPVEAAPQAPEPEKASHPETIPTALVLPPLPLAPESFMGSRPQPVVAASPAETSGTEASPAAPSGGLQQDYLRVPTSTVDQLMRMISELSISLGQIQEKLKTANEGSRELLNQDRLLQQRSFELENIVDVRGVTTVTPRPEQTESGFDPLELDQYNELYSTARAFIEAVTDAREMSQDMKEYLSELEGLLAQQERISKEFQQTLMTTRMVAVSTIAARLQRAVRQTCRTTGKQAELTISGNQVLIDSDILNKLVTPLMHVMRNAVDHGIESPEERIAASKSETGKIELSFAREGNNIVVVAQDDGRGLDLQAILDKARQSGLISPGAELVPDDIAQLVLIPGFSTRAVATHISGRGVGLDVVASTITELKGTIDIDHAPDRGFKLSLRFPVTLVSVHCLLVKGAGQLFAVPTNDLQQIVSPRAGDFVNMGKDVTYQLEGNAYKLSSLDNLLNLPARLIAREQQPLLIIESDRQAVACLVDDVVDNRDLIITKLGRFVPKAHGVAGASILGDGSVVPLLDMRTLLRDARNLSMAAMEPPAGLLEKDDPYRLPRVLIVDDSLSVRRSLTNLVSDTGYETFTARDGLEAIDVINAKHPDALLVDLEMPRMNGLELTAHVRSREEIQNLPIAMITSRSMEKHRKQAYLAGVNKYITKPYPESEVLDFLADAIEEARE